MFNYILIQNKRLNIIGHIFNINSISFENSSSNNAQDGAMDDHLDGENSFLQLEREREEEQGNLVAFLKKILKSLQKNIEATR